MKVSVLLAVMSGMLLVFGCTDKGTGGVNEGSADGGLKIAYVNADSILQNYKEFRVASQEMGAKQRKAEEQLQARSAELEKEIIAYQRQAQAGTLSRNEMEGQERRLAGKQEALMAERDIISEELYKETSEINERLKSVLRGKLNEIKEKEGYDFILSYMEGGSILVADAKYDITRRVLEELNKESLNIQTSDSLQ